MTDRNLFPPQLSHLAQREAPAPPAIVSLRDWTVGKLSDGTNEVRIVLDSDEEARAWAMWVLNA